MGYVDGWHDGGADRLTGSMTVVYRGICRKYSNHLRRLHFRSDSFDPLSKTKATVMVLRRVVSPGKRAQMPPFG